MAERAGLPCVPHSANLTLVTLFSLHLMGALSNAGPYVEFCIEPTAHYPWQAGLFSPPLEPRRPWPGRRHQPGLARGGRV